MRPIADLIAEEGTPARGGCLRSTVNVSSLEGRTRIEFGPWETLLPSSWANANPRVTSLLSGQLTYDEGLNDASTAPLAKLLAEQGCFLPRPKGDVVPLSEVLTEFEALKQQWYATYYAHPLWEQLAKGTASRNELVSWIIHNYHVSRSAGVVAARIATTQSRWSTFFRNDAIEEYWHCDAYYFIDSPNLGVPSEVVRSYVPLPSSRAFEDLCLRAAEQDEIAHILIAYFQEASIVFLQQSDIFYNSVEAAYQIPNFFQSWREHIRIDVNHKHADGLKSLFTEDIAVGRDELARALRTAWVAFYFLLSGLDDINQQRASAVELRYPPHRPSQTMKDAVSGLSGLDVAAIPSIVDELLAVVGPTAFRALAFSRSHAEVMLTGTVARLATERVTYVQETRRPWVLAVANFLSEVATRPPEWSACVVVLVETLLNVAPNSRAAALGDTILKRARTLRTGMPNAASEDCPELIFQFREVLIRALTSSAVIPKEVDSWLRT